MGNSNSKEPITPQISAETAARGIPHVVSLAYHKATTWKIRYILSEPGGEPRFIANMPNGIYHEIIFHEGPNLTDPVLAFVKTAGKWSQDFEITLPSLPSEGLVGGVEILRHSGARKERFWFGMQVGEGESRHIERFEWRRSHGAEVKSVGEGKWGWKLVRLGASAPEEEVEEGIQDLENE